MPIIDGRQKNSGTKITFKDAYTTFSSDKVANITLTEAKTDVLATNIGNHALFAGGQGAMGYSASTYSYSYLHKMSVDAYDTSLTHSRQPQLPYMYHSKGAVGRVGNYALFVGGTSADSMPYMSNANPSGNRSRYSYPHNYVTKVDNSLTMSHDSALDLDTSVYRLANANAGAYTLFGGGSTVTRNSDNNLTTKPLSSVIAFDASLTKQSIEDLISARNTLTGISVNGYALFGGGCTWPHAESSSSPQTDYTSKMVDAYSPSLTHLEVDNLINARYGIIPCSVGDYAVFYSGSLGGSNVTDNMDIYDSSLTHSRQQITNRQYGGFLSSCNTKDHMLLRMGPSYICVYDNSLTYIGNTKSTAGDGGGTYCVASTNIGDYALFAGGYYIYPMNDGTPISGSTVYDGGGAYHDAYYLKLDIPPFSKYKFSESEEQSTNISSVNKEYADFNNPHNGYIDINANAYLSGDVN